MIKEIIPDKQTQAIETKTKNRNEDILSTPKKQHKKKGYTNLLLVTVLPVRLNERERCLQFVQCRHTTSSFALCNGIQFIQ